MDQKKEPSALGKYLKELRIGKGVSLKQVEKYTDISGGYLSQIETGAKISNLSPNKLKKLAKYFDVGIYQMLEKAGYLDEEEESYEEKIEKKFLCVVNDPMFNLLVDPKEYSLKAKRLVINIYETLLYRNTLAL